MMPQTPSTFAEIAVLIAFFVNLLALIGGLWKGLGAMLSIRDDIRDMKVALGHREPPAGLIGDVHEMKRDLRGNHDAIIQLQAFVGHPMRRAGDGARFDN